MSLARRKYKNFLLFRLESESFNVRTVHCTFLEEERLQIIVENLSAKRLVRPVLLD